MKTKLVGFIFVLNALICFAQNATNEFTLPSYQGYVNDFEGILTQPQINELNEISSKHEQETSNEIAIVTITSFEPYETLFDYSVALSNFWGIGKPDKKNGIAIVFGKQIRQIRIQVGYGLEAKLNDKVVKRIIDETMIPAFKTGNYFEGIKKGLMEITDQLKHM
jgi:uncharacterized protein